METYTSRIRTVVIAALMLMLNLPAINTHNSDYISTALGLYDHAYVYEGFPTPPKMITAWRGDTIKTKTKQTNKQQQQQITLLALSSFLSSWLYDEIRKLRNRSRFCIILSLSLGIYNVKPSAIVIKFIRCKCSILYKIGPMQYIFSQHCGYWWHGANCSNHSAHVCLFSRKAIV